MSLIKNKLRNIPAAVSLVKILRNIRSTFHLLVGLSTYAISGKTPSNAHQAMVTLFCATKGRSNDFFSWIIGKIRRPYFFDQETKGIAGKVGRNAFHDAVSQLNEKGYYVLENKISPDMCDRLIEYAMREPCRMRLMEGGNQAVDVRTTYHRDAPRAVRYEFAQEDLLQNPDVQQLLADMSLAALAQAYLGARPVIDIVALWWHTRFSDKPDAEAAQYFHFDMDRFKWLKFFIYLTDVGTENGPHCFVAGTHRSGGIPTALLSKGYARLSDAEVELHCKGNDFVEFSAPRGTILAEDTRGLHKGKNVQSGDRLVLQIEFSNCLFGAFYLKTKLSKSQVPSLRETIRKYPDIYSYFQRQ